MSTGGRPEDLPGVIGLTRDLAELHASLTGVSTPEAIALGTVLVALEKGADGVTAVSACVGAWKTARATQAISAALPGSRTWEGLSSAVAVLTAGRGEFAEVLGEQSAAPALAAMTSITRGLLHGLWPDDHGRDLLRRLGLLALEERSP